jgi:hypothetical protein
MKFPIFFLSSFGATYGETAAGSGVAVTADLLIMGLSSASIACSNAISALPV